MYMEVISVLKLSLYEIAGLWTQHSVTNVNQTKDFSVYAHVNLKEQWISPLLNMIENQARGGHTVYIHRVNLEGTMHLFNQYSKIYANKWYWIFSDTYKPTKGHSICFHMFNYISIHEPFLSLLEDGGRCNELTLDIQRYR